MNNDDPFDFSDVKTNYKFELTEEVAKFVYDNMYEVSAKYWYGPRPKKPFDEIFQLRIDAPNLKGLSKCPDIKIYKLDDVWWLETTDPEDIDVFSDPVLLTIKYAIN